MAAGKRYDVNVTLENTGTDIWIKDDFGVGCHWYYLDGLEAIWDGGKTSLPSDVRPGERVLAKASVTPPPYDGQYYLVWDLAHGDKWASTTANTRGGDILVVPVNVIKGRLAPQRLEELYDSDISSFDTDRRDGDADGTGLTLPAEFLPPEVIRHGGTAPDDKLWPCGLWTSVQGSGLESSRRISFLYPSKAEGAQNAVTCKGQSVKLKSGEYVGVHLLLMAAEKVSGGEFALTYGDAEAAVQADFSAWNEPPAAGFHPAFVCLHRHSPDGDQRGQACYLTHYAIPANPDKRLTALVLPDNPAVKVLAVTLEKAK